MEGPAGPSIGGLPPVDGVVVTGVRWGIDPIDVEAVGRLPGTTGGSSLWIRAVGGAGPSKERSGWATRGRLP